MKKIISIIDDTPINQLEAEMYIFANKLRGHIQDAFNFGPNGMALDAAFHGSHPKYSEIIGEVLDDMLERKIITHNSTIAETNQIMTALRDKLIQVVDTAVQASSSGNGTYLERMNAYFGNQITYDLILKEIKGIF